MFRFDNLTLCIELMDVGNVSEILLGRNFVWVTGAFIDIQHATPWREGWRKPRGHANRYPCTRVCVRRQRVVSPGISPWRRFMDAPEEKFLFKLYRLFAGYVAM